MANEKVTARKGFTLRTIRNPRILFVLTVLFIACAAVAATWSLFASTRQMVVTAVSSHNFDIANDALTRLEQWGVDDPQLLVFRARMERLRGDTRQAQSLLNRAKERVASPRLVRREQLLLDTQTRVESVPLDQIERALNEDPDDAEAVYEATVMGLGVAGDFNAAFTVLQRWDAFAPGSPLPHYHRGKLQQVLEKFEFAETSFCTALKLDPDFTPARVELLKTLKEQNKAALALGLAREIVSTEPELVEARRIRADLLRDSHQQHERLADLHAIIKRYPYDYEARLELAQTYLRGDDANRAIEALAPIMFEHKSDVSVNYLLATANQHVGNQAVAELHLDRYLEARRELDRLLKLEQRYESGEAADAEGAKRLALGFLKYRWRKAELWAAEAYFQNPGDPQVLRAVATVARFRQDLAKSERFAIAADKAERQQSRRDHT